MPHRIRLIDKAPVLLRDTSTPCDSVSLDEVAAALGAEPTGLTVEGSQGPLTKFATRRESFEMLQADGCVVEPTTVPSKKTKKAKDTPTSV